MTSKPVTSNAVTVLQTGARIGILGGGQLGRLLALAAGGLGFDVHIYCPEQNCPASRVAAQTTVAAYDDADALAAFAADCDVITYEFENVPAKTVEIISAAGGRVQPNAKALEMSQDRVTEKTFLNEIEIPTVEFQAIGGGDDLEEVLAKFGGRGILKTRREGYDGKGQIKLDGEGAGSNVADAQALANERSCVLEAFAPFEREISVVVARGNSREGTVETLVFDPSENVHEHGILKRSLAPANISGTVQTAAIDAGVKLAEALDYIGVLAIEFFVMPDGALLANEFAPRVHNS
ncbi:MAG: ATP-grasp domain-containing protein, partial [Hyphomonadaceae bacterium]